MILYGDYHTHTIYSKRNHGKGSIFENALVAKEKGLKEIAITDHGFSHKLYGANRNLLSQMRKECDIATEKTGVRVLLGIEANIISSLGDVDVNQSDLDKLDILLCGYHRFASAVSVKEYFKFFAPNNLNAFTSCKKTIQRNTIALMRAIEKYPINVITHMGAGFDVNFLEVARLARDKGTFVELNGKRMLFSEQDIESMVQENVKFIVNSDAHKPENVGECNKGLNCVLKYNIPKHLVVNLNAVPEFKKIK